MRLKIWILILLLILAACNGDDEADDAGESLNPAALLENAAQQLDDADSFELVLEVSGAPVLLDADTIGLDTQIQFRRAEGSVARPDGLQANVTVLIEDSAVEIEMIAVAEDQYLFHPIFTLGQWQAITFSEDFNPETLVSGDVSIANALRSLQEVTYMGEADLDGLSVHHLHGQVEAAQVKAVTVDLIGTETGNVEADIFIRQDNGRLEQMVLVEPINPEVDPEAFSTWAIGIYNYGADVTITAPEVED
jgi:hypothetical protein